MEKPPRYAKEEPRNAGTFFFGNEVEQQRAQTGTQQSGGNAQAGEQRHQNRCAKHSKHMLHTQNKHSAGAQLFGVVYALE